MPTKENEFLIGTDAPRHNKYYDGVYLFCR